MTKMLAQPSKRLQLARVLCRVNCREFGAKSPDCERLTCGQWELFLPEVDAVLDELREPDEAMIRAGDACHEYAPGVATPQAYAGVEVTFPAMIDAIGGKHT